MTGNRRRAWWVTAAALLVLGGTFVAVWFQPQKLFIDQRVDEPPPAAAPDATDSAGTSGSADLAGAPDPLSGTFVSLDHHTAGTVRIVQQQVVLDGFETSNGPDLFVYLSANPADGPEGAFDDDVVNLGRLKGNIGNQNYAIPAGTDLAKYRSVVIWCDRFNSAFGAANLA